MEGPRPLVALLSTEYWCREDGLSRSAESLGFPWSAGLDAPAVFGEQLLDWTREKKNWTRQKGPFRKKDKILGGGVALTSVWVPFCLHPSVCQADPRPNLCPGKSVSVAGTRPIWQEHTVSSGGGSRKSLLRQPFPPLCQASESPFSTSILFYKWDRRRLLMPKQQSGIFEVSRLQTASPSILSLGPLALQGSSGKEAGGTEGTQAAPSLTTPN